ncbi:hypothetical protein CAL18_01595 [Bordetella genomosp. 7]|uniref:DoxX family protein n=1 Tax=Bordetella genomosp. 7 TaxID=1416805 RepID=UPI000B9DF801|nr:DoxX family protein [Bordetella genomosp. 7]OZI29626.1 hypothetical protein CAL18_01595 [Bordetella genomosp. 7]
MSKGRFDLTNGWNLLRIAAGAFFFPHVAGKFVGFTTINPMVLGFFETAGFSPAAAFVWLAAVLEAVVGVALVLGIFTRYAALAGAFILLTAAYALHSVTGFKGWVWNSGGYEYPVFWAIACLTVALEAFRQRRGSLRAVEPLAAA